MGARAHIAPGEELAAPSAAPAHARQAASVIVLRGGADALEVLLVQRTHTARFMPGVWVFPGGAVDTADGEDETAHRIAAARELREEASIDAGDPAALVGFSRWITPAEVAIRFDTHFFLLAAPDGAEPIVDGREIVDHRWLTPRAALDAFAAGALALVFPTIKHLEQLEPFGTADAVLDHARGRPVVPIQPQVVGQGETARVVLPDEPGYRA